MKILNILIVVIALSVKTSAQFHVAPTLYPIDGGIGDMKFSKAKIVDGDPKVLAGQKIQVSFVYDGMQVVDYGTEHQFVNAMISHFEAKKTSSGTQWALKWQADRDRTFPQLFVDKFNESGVRSLNSVQLDSAGTDYQLIITITSLDPGFEAWITREPALINATCDFRDKNGRTLLLVSMDHVPGRVFGKGDFDLNLRVGQCYAKLGKDLYNFISKKYKKTPVQFDDY